MAPAPKPLVHANMVGVPRTTCSLFVLASRAIRRKSHEPGITRQIPAPVAKWLGRHQHHGKCNPHLVLDSDPERRFGHARDEGGDLRCSILSSEMQCGD